MIHVNKLIYMQYVSETKPKYSFCAGDDMTRAAVKQVLQLSIWFTCPSGMWFWKFTCHAKIFKCPANIYTSPVKLMYTAGKISTCPDWKITCPVGHATTKVCVPWDKIYMPRACGHAFMSRPVKCRQVAKCDLQVIKSFLNTSETGNPKIPSIHQSCFCLCLNKSKDDKKKQ